MACVEGTVVDNGREILPNPHMERGRPSDALNLRTQAVGRRRQMRCRRAAPKPDWSSYTIAIVVEGTPTRRLSIRKDHSKARGFASSSFPPPANRFELEASTACYLAMRQSKALRESFPEL